MRQTLAMVLMTIFFVVMLGAFFQLFTSLPTYFTEIQKHIIFLFAVGIMIIVFAYVILKD